MAFSAFRATGELPIVTVTTNTSMAVNTRYITNSGGTLNMTIPPTSQVGAIIRLTNRAGLFTVKQNASQNIRLANQVSSTGTGGSIACEAVGDSLTLECEVADTTWFAVASVGASFTVT